MMRTIHFDPRSVRAVAGGVVLSFDSVDEPTNVEIIETAAHVTLTIHGEPPVRRRRFGRFAHREIFVPLEGPAIGRAVRDGSNDLVADAA